MNDGNRLGAWRLLVVFLAALPAQAVGPNGALNDTGTTLYGDATSNGLIKDPEAFPGQDARLGRDAKASAGTAPKAGFDFTALNASGNPTPPTSGSNPHPCVRDNVTGLVWEVKTSDSGLRDRNRRYTWYSSNGTTNGGVPGTAYGGGGSCASLPIPLLSDPNPVFCDTEKFVAEVNATALCTFTDWRLPTVKELESILDMGNSRVNINTTYFPNSVSAGIYTGSVAAENAASAWYIDFYYGNSTYNLKSIPSQVRLVRGGP